MEEEQKKEYEPRPRWQVWMARIGLLLFVALVIWETVRMAKGWY